MARAKPKAKKEPLAVVKSVKLPPPLAGWLQDLAQDASDLCGWTVAPSTILRVLVAHAQQQPSPWVREQLFPLIDREIVGGVTWGGKRRH
jgi:hypothetical protein